MIVFNENHKKAHLVRQFHSLMVFKESVFFKFEKIVVKRTPP